MRLSKGLVAVAVFTALTASIASAATVEYSTTGTFTSTGTSILTGANGSSITFTGVPFLTNLGVVDAPTTAPLGLFTTVAPVPGFEDSYAGQEFTLHILQTVPGGGSGSIAVDLTGTLRRSPSGEGGSTLFLDFTGSVPIGAVTYTPLDLGIAAGQEPTNSTLQGNIAINVVPVPMAVWGGMSLFGLLGGGRILARRRQLA